MLIIELSRRIFFGNSFAYDGQLVFVPKTSELKANSSELTAEEKFGGGHPSDSLLGKLPDKSTRVVIDLETAPNFSSMISVNLAGCAFTKPGSSRNRLFKNGWARTFGGSFTVDKFIERLNTRKNSGIKAVLLDQKVLAGVGNIYADESLYAAKIHPLMPVSKIPRDKLLSLYNDLRSILRLSIEKGGSTDRNYVNSEGKKGSYLSFAKVFKRQGQPCERCGTTIIKMRAAGRGTHICPNCQKF